MEYLNKLFTQQGIWTEVISASDSLQEESEVNHALDAIRVSQPTESRTKNAAGASSTSTADLYFLIGKSTADGGFGRPGIKLGDRITSPGGHVWSVGSVREQYGPLGDLHHLEIGLV